MRLSELLMLRCVKSRLFETIQHWLRMLKMCSPARVARTMKFRYIPWLYYCNQIYSVVRSSKGRVWEACSPVWPLSDQRGGDKWLQHSSLSALVGGGEQPSYRELHHPNNIILFMWLVDRGPVWLAWGSAQVNWKPELCNGTGSWADIVPLVITQEACVSVYRLHLRFMAPVWEWNIRGQVMDVAISGTEGAEMGHLYRKKKHSKFKLQYLI